jgi:hypothetical protein
MDINGNTPGNNAALESKTQNIDLATTIEGTTNVLGTLEINGIPVEAGSTPQPWPGDFDVGGNVNATQFKPLGGTTTMFLKGDGSLDLNTYVKTMGDTMTGSLTAPSLIKSGGTNIEYLMGDGSTLTQSATSGNSNFYLYTNTNSTTDSTPVSGEVIINSLANTTATIVYISHVTRDNIDVEVFWKFVNTLTELYLQDQNLSSNYIQYNIIAAPTITVGNKIAIPVSVVNSSGTGSTSFGLGHNILVSYFTNNLEVDTRLSALETKTQSQTATSLRTTFTGKTLIRETVGILTPQAILMDCDNTILGPSITSTDGGLSGLKPLTLGCTDFNLNCAGFNNIRCAVGQNINLIGNVSNTGYSTTSNSFITNGGLSTQFVKGNGTLDSSTYLTSAALTPLESKTQNLTAIANTTTNAGLFTSGSLAVSNGAFSTLITTTSGIASLPLILPAIQATSGQILQGSSTGQTSWVSASSSATDTTQRWISSAIGNDTTGNGTLSAPWATIAKGFTTGAQYPLKLNIRGTFVIGTLVLTAANSNTQITTTDGYEAQQSTLSGTIQTSGTMTRLKCSSFTFSSPAAQCLIFDDTAGRHVFNNCAFISAAAFPIFVGSTFTNWLNFKNCDFTGLTGGALNLDNVASACILRLYNCGVVPITIGTGWTVYISGSTVLVSPSAILGTVIQLPVEQFNAIITTQAAFNAISVDGLYINQVVGLTGLTGATFGCSFLRASAVKLISLGYNSLPASINVLNGSTYNTWVKDANVSGGWIALNQSLYVPLSGGTMTGTLTLGNLGIAMTLFGAINGNLTPSTNNTRILGQVGNAWNTAEITTCSGTTNVIRNGATNSTTLTSAAASASIPFVLPSLIGSASQFLTTNGSGQSSWASVAGAGPGLKGVRFFNTAGVATYTPTAGTTRALVFCCGGGGAGGGVGTGYNNAYGAGGNAGGQAIGYYVIDETKTGSFSIGLGGVGVASGAGGGGASTTFLFPSTGTPNAIISGGGAFGGNIKAGTTDDRMATANINVVSGTIPALNAVLLAGYTIGGPRGGYGFSTAGDTAISGVGGNSAFGVGGQENYVNNINTTVAGNEGNGNGSGGAGAVSTANGTAAGGNGRLGCILIYEY